MFVVFHYGIFPDEEIFRGMKVSMHSLANWFDVLDAAKNGSFFDSKTLDEVEKYLNDPVSGREIMAACLNYRATRTNFLVPSENTSKFCGFLPEQQRWSFSSI